MVGWEGGREGEHTVDKEVLCDDIVLLEDGGPRRPVLLRLRVAVAVALLRAGTVQICMRK